MVLLLNFVIAVLSATQAKFEDKQLGLYYEVIVAKFPAMEWDELYGAVVCAQPPMNVMIFPFWWMTLLPLPEKFLINFNMFLCYLLYFPISIFLTVLFTIIDMSYVFPAYFVHTLSLI